MKILLFLKMSYLLRFVKLLESENAIISNLQIIDSYKMVLQFFSKRKDCSIDELLEKDIFMFLDGSDLAAFMYIQKSDFYYDKKEIELSNDSLKKYLNGEKFLKENNFFNIFLNYLFPEKKIKSLGIYCVTVMKKYRGQGLGKKLLKKVKEHYLSIYNSKNTMFALHLAAKDADMPVAAKIYYTCGFKNFIWVENDPKDLQRNFNYYFNNCMDFYTIDKNFKGGKGNFLASFCYLNDCFKNKIIEPKNFIEIGEKVRKLMKSK